MGRNRRFGYAGGLSHDRHHLQPRAHSEARTERASAARQSLDPREDRSLSSRGMDCTLQTANRIIIAQLLYWIKSRACPLPELLSPFQGTIACFPRRHVQAIRRTSVDNL